MFIFVWPALLASPDFQLGYIAKDTKTIIQDEHVALSISDLEIFPSWSASNAASTGKRIIISGPPPGPPPPGER